MKYHGMLWLFLSLAVALCDTSPAQALNDVSWVASNGLDGNPCTRGQPCGTFARALSQTNAGGEINCVDAGEFLSNQTITITQSVTIACETGATLRGGS